MVKLESEYPSFNSRRGLRRCLLVNAIVAVYYLEAVLFCLYWELTSVLWGRSSIVLLSLRIHFGPLGMKQYCSVYIENSLQPFWDEAALFCWLSVVTKWLVVGVFGSCGLWLRLWNVDWCIISSSNAMSSGLVVFVLVWGRWSVCDMFDYLYKCAENSIMSVKGTSFNKRLIVS